LQGLKQCIIIIAFVHKGVVYSGLSSSPMERWLRWRQFKRVKRLKRVTKQILRTKITRSTIPDKVAILPNDNALLLLLVFLLQRQRQRWNKRTKRTKHSTLCGRFQLSINLLARLNYSRGDHPRVRVVVVMIDDDRVSVVVFSIVEEDDFPQRVNVIRRWEYRNNFTTCGRNNLCIVRMSCYWLGCCR